MECHWNGMVSSMADICACGIHCKHIQMSVIFLLLLLLFLLKSLSFWYIYSYKAETVKCQSLGSESNNIGKGMQICAGKVFI